MGFHLRPLLCLFLGFYFVLDIPLRFVHFTFTLMDDALIRRHDFDEGAAVSIWRVY
jgi:hypothetical protein